MPYADVASGPSVRSPGAVAAGVDEPGREPTFGLLAPLRPMRGNAVTGSPRPGPDGAGLVDLIRSRVVDAVWLRDLPVTPTHDEDAGQGTDPFAHLAQLAGAGALPPVVGTASVILGTRHPLVLARAALTVQALTEGRFILGLGTGGKAAMNTALGIADRTVESFAAEWWAVRRALRGDVGEEVRLQLSAPCEPPPLYLATTDTERWRTIDGDPDGWLAFAGEDRAFCTQLDELCRISGRQVRAAVRLDLIVVPRADAPLTVVPDRGRATGTLDQLTALLSRWRRMPVTHLLVNVRGRDPVGDLRRLAEA